MKASTLLQLKKQPEILKNIFAKIHLIQNVIPNMKKYNFYLFAFSTSNTPNYYYENIRQTFCLILQKLLWFCSFTID